MVDLAKVFRKVYGRSTIAAPLPIVHENYRMLNERSGGSRTEARTESWERVLHILTMSNEALTAKVIEDGPLNRARRELWYEVQQIQPFGKCLFLFRMK